MVGESYFQSGSTISFNDECAVETLIWLFGSPPKAMNFFLHSLALQGSMLVAL